MKIKTSVFLIKQNFPFNGHTKKLKSKTKQKITHKQTNHLASLLLEGFCSSLPGYLQQNTIISLLSYFYHDAFPFVHYFKKQSRKHCPVSRKTLLNSNGRFKGGGMYLKEGVGSQNIVTALTTRLSLNITTSASE